MILLRMFLSSLLFFLNPVPSQRDQILNEDQFEPGQWNTYICFELLIVKITVDDIHLNVFYSGHHLDKSDAKLKLILARSFVVFFF